MEEKTHSLIKSTRTSGMPIPGTSTGYINIVENVFRALVDYFELGNSRDVQQSNSSRNRINNFHFFLYARHNNPVQPHVETFHTLTGISSNYRFAVNMIGIVLMCQRSYWCLCCILGSELLGNYRDSRVLGPEMSNGR